MSLAAGAWAIGWVAMVWADGHTDLSNLAMLLVLTSAIATLWLPVVLSALASAASVLAFNWAFVPPRGTFSVDLGTHAWLLVAMLLVNWIIAALMAAQRLQAHQAGRSARQAEQLRQWGDTLRDAADPQTEAGALQAMLAGLWGTPAAVLVLKEGLPPGNDDQAGLWVGELDSDQRAGLWHCLRSGQAMGPGTLRHRELQHLYLPLRGRGVTLGAAVVQAGSATRREPTLQAHAQALADQMGLALQRALALRDELRAREEAQGQRVRNALLAAISHDYRTPLATIMGAASSLEDQAQHLDPEQRRRLAHTIVDEAQQLSRLTDNTLQLARLDAPGVSLRCDWESAEELVGTVLQRARRRDPARRVRARLEPGLPLLWCDALLLTQLLENLVDNALKYSPPDAPVEILVRALPDHVMLAVRDRGPGIAPDWRECVFQVFHRGAEPVDAAVGTAVAPAARAGAGVGLAVCRAIAVAHGGELRLRARGHGGSSFECWLPRRTAPELPAVAAKESQA